MAEVRTKAATLDHLIAEKGLPLSAPMVVHRGAFLPGVSYDDLQASVGTTREDAAFVSTMLGPAEGRVNSYPVIAATEYLYDKYQKVGQHLPPGEVGQAVQFNIHLPAGTKVLSVEAARRYDPPGKYSSDRLRDKNYRSESEILLGPRARFKVRSVGPLVPKTMMDFRTPVTVVELEYVGGGSSQWR